jgi:hypothetical protein
MERTGLEPETSHTKGTTTTTAALQHLGYFDDSSLIYEPMELRGLVATLGWPSCFTGTTWRTVTSFPPSFFLFNL